MRGKGGGERVVVSGVEVGSGNYLLCRIEPIKIFPIYYMKNMIYAEGERDRISLAVKYIGKISDKNATINYTNNDILQFHHMYIISMHIAQLRTIQRVSANYVEKVKILMFIV